MVSAGSNSFIQQPNSALFRAPTPSSLLPLPQNVLEQIQSGKFFNFDLLLPATSPLSVEDYTIKVNIAGSEPSVSLVPRAQSRPRVIEFYSWLTAWNYYLQATSFYHPTRVPELIMYQSINVRFSCQYTIASWYAYDKLFRYHMANHPMMPWSQVDDDFFNRYLRGTPLRVLCFSCCNYGHLASSCPTRSTNTNLPSPSSSSSTSPSYQGPPFRDPPSIPTSASHHHSRLNHYSHVGFSTTTTSAISPTVGFHTSVMCVIDHTLKPDVPSNEIIDTNPKSNSKFVDANFNPLPSSVCSPINVPVLTSMLQTHPDRKFVKFLLDGFTFGFQIGYTGPMTPGECNNLLSARTHPQPVNALLIKELNRGHTSGPFLQPPFAQLHCSPLWAVTKKDGTYHHHHHQNSLLGT